MKLSVVVPVHNEAENIYSVADKICENLNGRHDYELIFVDDGSNDQTGTVLRKLQKRFPRLRVIRHIKRCGQSAALCTGVRYAVNPLVITLDGDGQNDPRDIERLLKVYETLPEHAGRIMVIGFRRIRHDPAWRRFSSKFANAVRSRLLRDQTSDTGCGLKVFPRELFLSLPCFDHMHRFLPALVKRTGG
jgi:dolichol-phosphate mannosyltransferase